MFCKKQSLLPTQARSLTLGTHGECRIPTDVIEAANGALMPPSEQINGEKEGKISWDKLKCYNMGVSPKGDLTTQEAKDNKSAGKVSIVSTHTRKFSKEEMTDGKGQKTRKKKYLTTRTDVLKKTVLTALRKQYQKYFSLFLLSLGLKAPLKLHEFYVALAKYSEYIKSFVPAHLLFNHGQLPELHFALGMFIDYCKIKKFKMNSRQNRLQTLFHGVLYKFSHEKFSALLEFPEIRFIFSQVLIDTFIENFIRLNPTMDKEFDRYKLVIEQIKEEIKIFDDHQVQNEENKEPLSHLYQCTCDLAIF